jgi:hypothetical protein
MERQGKLQARLLILRHQLEIKKHLGVVRVALNERRKDEMRGTTQGNKKWYDIAA